MGIQIGAGFRYHAKYYLDERQGIARTKLDLKEWTVPVPEGFEVYLMETGLWYTYSSTNDDQETGKFKPRSGGLGQEDIDRLTAKINEAEANAKAYTDKKVSDLVDYLSTGKTRCVVESLNGDEFGGHGWKTVLKASVVIGAVGAIDVTQHAEYWKWTRTSGDDTADAVWNAAHEHHNNRELSIEVGVDIPYESIQCIFNCSVNMPNEVTLEGGYGIQLTG